MLTKNDVLEQLNAELAAERAFQLKRAADAKQGEIQESRQAEFSRLQAKVNRSDLYFGPGEKMALWSRMEELRIQGQTPPPRTAIVVTDELRQLETLNADTQWHMSNSIRKIGIMQRIQDLRAELARLR